MPTERKRIYYHERWRRIKAERDAHRLPDLISKMTDADAAYIAGLLDGEGCFCIPAGRQLQPTVQIIMTAKSLIEWVGEKWGTRAALFGKKRHRASFGKKPQFYVRLCGKRAALLCERVAPYLKLKTRQAQVIRDFVDTYYKTPWVRGEPHVSPGLRRVRLQLKKRMSKLNA